MIKKFLLFLWLLPIFLFAAEDFLAPLELLPLDPSQSAGIVDKPKSPVEDFELMDIDETIKQEKAAKQPEQQKPLEPKKDAAAEPKKEPVAPKPVIEKQDAEADLVPLDEQEIFQKVDDFRDEPQKETAKKRSKPAYNFYGSFSENPATLALRDAFFLEIPLGLTLTFKNSNLSWNDFVTMFEEDHFLTDAEKQKIYGKSWDVFLAVEKPIIGIGYSNFEFASKAIVSAEIKDLGTQWLKFLFEGNDKDKMVLEGNSGQGSQALAFVKNSFTYAVPSPLTFLETDFYFGLDFNIYNSIGYAKVEKSQQTMDMDAGKSVLEYEYLRSKFGTTKVNSTTGFGLGMMVDRLPDLLFLDEGRAYASVDDLFAKIRFSDLEKVSYRRNITDVYDKDEKVDTVIVDTTVDVADYTVKLTPEYSVGASYSLFSESAFGSMRLVSKYRKALVAYDQGFSVGVDYNPFECLPIGVRYGLDGDSYFALSVGLDWYVDLAVRYVSYGTKIGGGAKGFTLGLDVLRFKF